MLFVFDDIRDRLTNRYFLFLNRSLAQSSQKVAELLDAKSKPLAKALWSRFGAVATVAATWALDKKIAM